MKRPRKVMELTQGEYAGGSWSSEGGADTQASAVGAGTLLRDLTSSRALSQADGSPSQVSRFSAQVLCKLSSPPCT